MTDRSRVMTLVGAGCSLAKRATVIDGVVCSTADPPWPRICEFTPIKVNDPGDLLDVLSTASEERIAPCVVRAEPKADIGRRAIYDDPEKGSAGMFPVPRAWVGFDIEKVPNKPGLAGNHGVFRLRPAGCALRLRVSRPGGRQLFRAGIGWTLDGNGRSRHSPTRAHGPEGI